MEPPYFPMPKTDWGNLQYRRQKVEIDEELLKYIASETDGKYFRATNNLKLKSIYEEINKLEKTKVEEFKYYNYSEQFRMYVLLALGIVSVRVCIEKYYF